MVFTSRPVITSELTLALCSLTAVLCSVNGSQLRSQSPTLYTSLISDGTNGSSEALPFSTTAPFPQISHHNSYASEDGLAVIIMFEEAVQMATRSSTNWLLVCELLTNETIDYLSFYGLKSCVWTSKVQMVITVEKPISENPVHIKFNKHVLKRSNQNELEVTASRVAAEPGVWGYEPVLAITGPSEIPDCGIFGLVGHFSWPRGTTDVQFRWEVTGQISGQLKEHMENHGKSTNLILDADFLEYHVPYKFVLKALLPSREQTLEVGHTVVKLDYDSPLVSIYHNRLLQSTPLYSDQDITLLADVSLPHCVFPVQRIILFWKVLEPQIPNTSNDSIKHSLSFEVRTNRYPVEKAVDIYLNAFLGHRLNQTSGARFTFVSSRAPLTARIADGFTKMTIGSESGPFRLWSNSSMSSHNLVYHWSCHDSSTGQPCYYNFGASALIDGQVEGLPQIELDSKLLQPNRTFWFGLQVIDKNDSKVFSETEYTLVKVVRGSAPQVMVGPVYIKGKHSVAYNPRLSTYLVPERTPLTVRATIRPVTLIKSIRWEAPNGLFDLNWSNRQIGQQIHSELYLHQSQIHAFGVYVVKLIACNEDDICSDADTSLMALQSASMCELVVDHFTEYTLTIASIEKCNTPPNAAPLTYQLFLADEGLQSPMPLSVPQYSAVIKFIGSPIVEPDRIARFAAQVCDRFGNCNMYYSSSVNIEENANETAAISDLTKIAKRHHTAGDSILALSVLGTSLLKHRQQLTPTNEKVINDSIEYSRHALQLPEQTLTDGHLAVVFGALSNGLLSTRQSVTKIKLLQLIRKFIQKAKAMNTLPTIETIASLYSNLMKALAKRSDQTSDGHSYELFLAEIRKVFKELRSVAASQTPLGSTVRLTSHSVVDGLEVDNAITEVMHSYRVYDTVIRARLSGNTTVEAQINFGDEVKNNYSAFWNCEQRVLCQSVVFITTIYPNQSPFPLKEEVHRLSPIVEMSVHAPNTGKEQEVRGLFKAAFFKVTVTGNATKGGTDMKTECHYWDRRDQRWRVDDVHHRGIVYQRAQCWTGHLSAFVVLRTVAGISADYVIGVLVACLMGVLVFGIMVVFFVQKKRDDNARVSPKPAVSSPKKPLENPRYRQTKPNSIEIQASVSQSVLITDE